MDLIEKYLGEVKDVFISQKEALNMLKKHGLKAKREKDEDGMQIYSASFGRTKHTFVFKKNKTIQKRWIDDAIEDSVRQGIGKLSGFNV
jgi:hypothetical protein